MKEKRPPVYKHSAFDTRLLALLKATADVEELIFGHVANTTLRAVLKPNLALFEEPLQKLTKAHGFDCVELATILTTSATLLPDSDSIRDSANWLIGVKKEMPPVLQSHAGLAAIRKALDSGDTKFFIALGERLHYLQKPSQKKDFDEAAFSLKWWLVCRWKPDPRTLWPGLAYCKDSANWDFLTINSFSSQRGANYLGNLSRRIGLAPSKKGRFISRIRLVNGQYKFS